MITLNKLPINEMKLLQNACVASNGRAFYNYEEGVKKSIGGTSYDLLLPNMDYEKAVIKIMGEMTPSISYEGEPIPVEFVKPTVKAWQDFNNGEVVRLSITAEKIMPAGKMKLNKGGSEA